MLRLSKISKDYKTADTVVHALKEINLAFRKDEFVAILGPSGCGKTTLLNIIGGLDKYTDGDLVISNRSTKEYSNRDWDVYRNHRIGFVFQSYNLIPHQTILENVELSLTIAGLDKNERIKRSKEALDKVGLKNLYNKKPNQLSGGQCQRVAIARALVNEPEILLADEPTGALDTATSIQIMELIKEISKEKLVIMVTHNPALAEQYATRIVRLLDGEVVDDSNPYSLEDEKKEYDNKVVEIKNERAKMSFWTAFKLSARNLKSKLKRTIMVCFAGSIGIIGVASVLAVSSGVSNYVKDMQDDMLSGNPITIQEQALDYNSIMNMMSSKQKEEAIKDSIVDGKINVEFLLDYLISRGADGMFVSNDIDQKYVDYVNSMPKEYYAAMANYYGIDAANNIYTEVNLEGGSEKMSLTALRNLYVSILDKTDYASYSSMITTMLETFSQAPNDEEYILSQYDIISNIETSHIAKDANEIMIVVSDDNELTDMLLTQLGYYSQEQFMNIIYRNTDDSKYNPDLDKKDFSYDELIGKRFTYYPNDTIYNRTTNPALMATNPFTYNAFESDEWTTGEDFVITAILRPKESINYGCLMSGFYYTESFTHKYIDENINSEITTYIDGTDEKLIQGTMYNGIPIGITYNYGFSFEGTIYDNVTGFVGQMNSLAALMGSVMGGSDTIFYTLSLREVGGINVANQIDIYPIDFDSKYLVTDYLDLWNGDEDIVVNGITYTKDERQDITYSDNLALVIGMINNMIDIVTYALIAFTALSLVVSTVMIGIITYVSVIERIKEIGVIRSLGGRKKDVSHLFNAETFIVGGISGLFGIGVTYLLSGLINLIVGSATGIYTIAALPWWQALVMILVSVILTSISGVAPARIAAQKDPVNALRSE